MIINCDKFFVEELQKNGYEIDYKKIVDIYKVSRNSDGFKKRQLKKEKEATEIQKHIEKYY
ncbi:hypothetical protein HB162lentus_29100 [Mammaliicoccus lentus]|uniref:hypothetical protein n=1 Tax=Staphylococcus TaxID=1279 RepID=UPI0013F5ADE0|nr:MULTISPECIES: hypothetical protein [Staphylococcus]MCS4499674.1 hypothetical protein [Staphylococcus aureus]MCS5404095.1 hypothetical protein [Staphylococcus aureus]MCS5431123.1 hypothetical protein [Staphylococcus aureus]MCT6538634.1 hypothetical protein [Staphylococcus aureus]NHE28445.1 hypothetical protein [Staphylococcus aureus]